METEQPSIAGPARFAELLGELQELHVTEVSKLSAEVADLRKQLKGPRMSPPVAPPAAWEMEDSQEMRQFSVTKLVSNVSPAPSGLSPDEGRSQDDVRKPKTDTLKIPTGAKLNRKGSNSSSVSFVPTIEEELSEELGHQESHLRERMKSIFLSTNFEFVIAMLLIVNLLLMAAQLQYHGFVNGHAIGYPRYATNPETAWPYAADIFFGADVLFAFLFTVEMFWRLLKIRAAFFKHCLNWVDFLELCSSWLELFAQALPISPTFLRLLRLGKLLRALRVVRMSQVLESLQLLLKCIYASLRILFWSLVLLMIIQCSAGMTISYMLSDFMVTDDGNAEARFQVFRYYGTFSKTLLTMCEVLFANWAPACRVLIDNVSEWWALGFIVYRCFVGFAVLNVVSAVFIQTTMKVAHEDEEVIAFEKTKAQEIYRRRVNNMFREADTSGDGFIDFQEFKRMLEHPQLQVWLHQLEIQTDDLLGLFCMLDDGDGEISLEEFETGIMKIKGIARSFDLNKLQRQVRKMNAKLDFMLVQNNLSDLQQSQLKMDRASRKVVSNVSPAPSGELMSNTSTGEKYSKMWMKLRGASRDSF